MCVSLSPKVKVPGVQTYLLSPPGHHLQVECRVDAQRIGSRGLRDDDDVMSTLPRRTSKEPSVQQGLRDVSPECTLLGILSTSSTSLRLHEHIEAITDASDCVCVSTNFDRGTFVFPMPSRAAFRRDRHDGACRHTVARRAARPLDQ